MARALRPRPVHGARYVFMSGRKRHVAPYLLLERAVQQSHRRPSLTSGSCIVLALSNSIIRTSAGYDWTALPELRRRNGLPGPHVPQGHVRDVALTVYVSSNHYSNTGNPNYLGARWQHLPLPF